MGSEMCIRDSYVRIGHKLLYGVPIGHRNLFSAVWFGFCLCQGSGRHFVHVICPEYHEVAVLDGPLVSVCLFVVSFVSTFQLYCYYHHHFFFNFVM